MFSIYGLDLGGMDVSVGVYSDPLAEHSMSRRKSSGDQVKDY